MIDLEGNVFPEAPIRSFRKRKRIQVFVRIPQGKTLALQYDPETTVEELKKGLSCKTGAPSGVLTLIFQGKVLESRKTLRHYKIGNESTLFCTIRPDMIAGHCYVHSCTSINPKQLLHNAIDDAHYYCVKGLMNSPGCDINALHDGLSPLMRAVTHNLIDMTELLLRHKDTEVIALDASESPLHIACRHNFWEIANVLCEREELVNALDENDNAPLHVAAKHGSAACVAILLQKEPLIDIENGKGQTPLHIAMKKGHITTSYLLVKAGASPAYLDHVGDTPIDKYNEFIKAPDFSSSSSSSSSSSTSSGSEDAPPPESPPYVSPEFSLGDSLSFLFNNPNFSDFRFMERLTGRTLFAHKCVLAATSEYFRGMFLGSMMESRLDKMEIDEDFETFRSLLYFMYTGKFSVEHVTLKGDEDEESSKKKMRTCSELLDVVLLGDRYCVQGIKQASSSLFYDCLTVKNIASNFGKLLEIPFMEARCGLFLRCCCEFVIQNWSDIVDSGTCNQLTLQMMDCVDRYQNRTL